MSAVKGEDDLPLGVVHFTAVVYQGGTSGGPGKGGNGGFPRSGCGSAPGSCPSLFRRAVAGPTEAVQTATWGGSGVSGWRETLYDCVSVLRPRAIVSSAVRCRRPAVDLPEA